MSKFNEIIEANQRRIQELQQYPARSIKLMHDFLNKFINYCEIDEPNILFFKISKSISLENLFDYSYFYHYAHFEQLIDKSAPDKFYGIGIVLIVPIISTGQQTKISFKLKFAIDDNIFILKLEHYFNEIFSLSLPIKDNEIENVCNILTNEIIMFIEQDSRPVINVDDLKSHKQEPFSFLVNKNS